MLRLIVPLTLILMQCLTASVTIPVDDAACSRGGRMLADGEIPTPEDVAKDAFCARRVIARSAPNGVITIFGSSRAKEDWESYKLTRAFAEKWTREMGNKFPILTGGGPGIMEAGNRGAKEAGGKSLFFSTHFGSGAEKPNGQTTDGYLASSFSQREADMVDWAAGVVIASGGVGTEWEIFETISKIQTKKKPACPVVLLGKREIWTTLFARLEAMKAARTISGHELALFQVAETPEQAVAILKSGVRGLK